MVSPVVGGNKSSAHANERTCSGGPNESTISGENSCRTAHVAHLSPNSFLVSLSSTSDIEQLQQLPYPIPNSKKVVI
jgi:hypothetical protein